MKSFIKAGTTALLRMQEAEHETQAWSSAPCTRPCDPSVWQFSNLFSLSSKFFFSSDTIEITSFTNEDFQKQHSNELASSPFHY